MSPAYGAACSGVHEWIAGRPVPLAIASMPSSRTIGGRFCHPDLRLSTPKSFDFAKRFAFARRAELHQLLKNAVPGNDFCRLIGWAAKYRMASRNDRSESRRPWASNMKLSLVVFVVGLLPAPLKAEGQEHGRIKWRPPTQAETDRKASELATSDTSFAGAISWSQTADS